MKGPFPQGFFFFGAISEHHTNFSHNRSIGTRWRRLLKPPYWNLITLTEALRFRTSWNGNSNLKVWSQLRSAGQYLSIPFVEASMFPFRAHTHTLADYSVRQETYVKLKSLHQIDIIIIIIPLTMDENPKPVRIQRVLHIGKINICF